MTYDNDDDYLDEETEYQEPKQRREARPKDEFDDLQDGLDEALGWW